MNNNYAEPLHHVFIRIARDSAAVNVPVTATQLAGAAVLSGYRHPDHPDAGPRTILALRDLIEQVWPADGDPRTAARRIEAAGWAPPIDGRRRFTPITPDPVKDWRSTSNAEKAAIRADREANGCIHGHGPARWNTRQGYCTACRAITRAKNKERKLVGVS